MARDIAAVLGANTKKDGYLEGAGYAVTYAFGHLVQIAEPEAMNAAWGKPWRLEQLPMIPQAWKYRIADKADASICSDKETFLRSGKIICARDAGRVSENIFTLKRHPAFICK